MDEKSRKNTDVYIVVVDGLPLVRPATLIVPPGKTTVDFRNAAEIPFKVILPPKYADPAAFTLPEKHGRMTVKILDPGDCVAFSYEVVDAKLSLAAQGNSSPIMIIDR